MVDQTRRTDDDVTKIGKKCDFTRGCHEKSSAQSLKATGYGVLRLRKVDNAGLLPIAEPTTSLTTQQITVYNTLKQS